MDKITELKKVITDLKEESLNDYLKCLEMKAKKTAHSSMGEAVAYGIVLMKIDEIFKK